MSFNERFAQQTGRHLAETGTHQRQKDTSDDHMITGLRLTRSLATAKYRHRAWYMAGRYLITVLLNLELLEFDEFGAARLQIQAAARFVDSAIFRWAIGHWHE